MILLISPAKKLDFDITTPDLHLDEPLFLDQSQKLINKLKRLSRRKIAQLMSLSANLSELNYNRYQSWSTPFTPENAKPAIYAFRGDVYIGYDADSMTEENIEFAQKHLRILSGLHGVLRPMDLIQPHRLEMGTRLPVARKKNLYEFWRKHISQHLNKTMEVSGSDLIINLASNEYFKSVDLKSVKGNIITCSFKEHREEGFKAIMLFVKQARGMMARYIIDHKITEPELMKGFNKGGYEFYAPESDEHHFCFVR